MMMSSLLLRAASRSSPVLLRTTALRHALPALASAPALRGSHAPARAASSGPDDGITFTRRWAHKLSGFNKYGLYHDDLLQEFDHPEVTEALRRLPPHLVDSRSFRIIRASQCCLKHIYLPKEEWPTLEEDLEKGRYLQPYIDEVLREFAEKEKWSKLM